MPVSRKRKKPRKSKAPKGGHPARAAARAKAAAFQAPPPAQQVPNILNELAQMRQRMDARREKIAAEESTLFVDALADASSDLDDVALEDAFCAQAGPLMHRLEHAEELDDYVDPDAFMEAVVTSTTVSIAAALEDVTGDESDVQGPWRVLCAARNVLPDRVLGHVRRQYPAREGIAGR